MGDPSEPGRALPIITLTSDFGLRDPFVGVIKGVILGICPNAHLVDLTHEIGPQDVLGAQLALESSVGFFPPGSIHLAVVDPGVGSGRRALALRVREHYFVGPDNGLFTFALSPGGWSAVALDAPDYRLPEVSQSFHGRDVFAPAAAHLARGVPLHHFGCPVTDPVRLELPAARREGEEWVGEVLGSDRFGNLITSVKATDLPETDLASTTLEIAGVRLDRLVTAYGECRENAPGAIIGSSGRIEVFIRNGSASAELGVERGAPVRLRVGRDSG